MLPLLFHAFYDADDCATLLRLLKICRCRRRYALTCLSLMLSRLCHRLSRCHRCLLLLLRRADIRRYITMICRHVSLIFTDELPAPARRYAMIRRSFHYAERMPLPDFAAYLYMPPRFDAATMPL